MSCEGRVIGVPFCGFKNVVRSKHQQLCFQYSSIAQRYVNRHLVTIKVGVERCTLPTGATVSLYLRSILAGKPGLTNGAALGHGLTIPGDLSIYFQGYPKLMASFLSTNFLGRFYCFYNTSFNQLTDDKWFEQFSSHIFW